MFPYKKRSVATTAFTASLATNARASTNLTQLLNSKVEIKSVNVLSKQQLAWDVEFYGKDGFVTGTDLATDYYQSRVAFGGSDAKIVAATRFHYFSTCSIPYIDEDETNELHIAIANRAGTTKTAGVGGQVVVEVIYEPSNGY